MPQHLETIVMYEDENLADQLRAQKAAAIIQQALHPGTVLFTFGSDVFQDRTLAYNAIEKEIGPAKGFRPISLYGNQRRNELIIEANFRNIEDASRAIKQGFAHEGIQYRGTPSNDGAESKLVRVSLSHLPLEDPDDLCDGLLNSLRYYGRVVQLKRFTKDGFFEGEAAAILDCSPMNGKEYQKLDRMLYLMEWDLHVPASFKGAPPVCYHCRQAGHVKATCPSLARIICFHCRQNGHTAKNCKKRVTTFQEEMDDYVTVRNRLEKADNNKSTTIVTAEESMSTKESITVDNIKEVQQNDATLTEEDTTQEMMEDEQSECAEEPDTEMSNAEKEVESNAEDDEQLEGLSASIHAPIESSTQMKVDSIKEMLAVTTAKPARRKLSHITTPINEIKKATKGVRVIDEPITIFTPAGGRATSKTTSSNTSHKAK
jgi:Zinc knuckle